MSFCSVFFRTLSDKQGLKSIKWIVVDPTIGFYRVQVLVELAVSKFMNFSNEVEIWSKDFDLFECQLRLS